MDRQFFGFPFGGFGGFGFPFFSPFGFGRRRFFPSFFLHPFPFFRGEEDRNTMFYEHHVKDGETYDHLATMYNVPRPIIESMNTHIQEPHLLSSGMLVYIPRMDKMHCRMTFVEDVGSDVGMEYPTQQMMPYSGMPNNMYPQHFMPAQVMPNKAF